MPGSEVGSVTPEGHAPRGSLSLLRHLLHVQSASVQVSSADFLRRIGGAATMHLGPGLPEARQGEKPLLTEGGSPDQHTLRKPSRMDKRSPTGSLSTGTLPGWRNR